MNAWWLAICVLSGQAWALVWEACAAMPTPRRDAACAVVGDTMYVIGGRVGGPGQGEHGLSDVVEAYLPSEDRWLTGFASTPHPMADMACAVVGGRVYLFGGNVGTSVSSRILGWSPPGGTWETEHDSLPVALKGAWAISVDDSSALVGGGMLASGGYSAQVWRFTPHGGLQEQPPLLQARAACFVGRVEGAVVVGGGFYHGPLSSTEVWTGGQWLPGPALPSPRGACGSAGDGERAYLLGGQGVGGVLREVLVLTSPDEGWQVESPMTSPRARAVAGVVGGWLVVAGGVGPAGQAMGCERAALGNDAAVPLPTLRLRVFPNPCAGHLWVEGPLGREVPWSLRLVRVDGALVGSWAGVSDRLSVSVPLPHDLPQGWYVLVARAGSAEWRTQLVRLW